MEKEKYGQVAVFSVSEAGNNCNFSIVASEVGEPLSKSGIVAVYGGSNTSLIGKVFLFFKTS